MKRQPVGKVDASVDALGIESVNLSVPAIGGRIKAARKALGLTQDQLAAMAGATSNRGLQDNEGGRSMPGGQMLGTLALAGVNANWLLTGEGPMLLADLVLTKSEPARINRGALAALLRGAIAITAQGMSVEAAADMAAEMYERALQNGEITPEGIGRGSLGNAA